MPNGTEVKKANARVLVEEVVFGGVIDVGLTGRHGVEHFERAHERTGRHLVERQLPIGHGGDVIDGKLCGVVENGEAIGNRRDQCQLTIALGVGRGGESRRSSRRAAECRRAQK
jgi:hypothetical protein